MKKYFILLFLVSLSAICIAQSNSNNFGFGFNINHTQNDFGIGLDMVSPYFADSKVAIKLGVNFKWLEHIEENVMTWTPYQNVQLGVRGRQFIIENKFFIYGEGGSIILFPNANFSSQKTTYGGYGLFGFEFKPTNKFGFYLELGGVGTGAKAENIIHQPIYSNGFLTNVGFRITP